MMHICSLIFLIQTDEKKKIYHHTISWLGPNKEVQPFDALVATTIINNISQCKLIKN